ncbi:hypothetical protein DV736_g3185, partial [Chaetothyriales sp. CBS 134916]
MARVFDPLPDFSQLDDASAELILRLQLDDVKSFKERCRGKQKEGDVDDGEYAATLLEKNLHEINMFLTDRRMTRSVANAVQTDGPLLEKSVLEEQTACEDRAIAHRFNGSHANSDVHLQPEPIDDAILSKLAGRYVSEEMGQALECGIELREHSDDEVARSEGSRWASHRRKNQQAREDNRHCEACRETKKYFDLIQAPCRHEYCIDCIQDLFNSSMTDESLFPPKCCRTPIPLKSVEIFIPKQLKQTFEEKKVEFGTPNRTYCSHPTCSVFIKATNIVDDVAVCPRCLTETCTLCKAAAHSGTDCPNDPNMQAVVDLARESGWQRCYEYATAALNFATNVEFNGKSATAVSGGRRDFIHEPTKSFREMLHA